jgi:hypothetical protein
MACAEINAGFLSAGDSVSCSYADIRNQATGAFFRSLEAGAYGNASAPITDVVIGPLFSRDADISGQVLATFQIGQIATTASAPEFADKSKYPFFSRVTPNLAGQGKALAQLCYNNGWLKVATIATTDSFGVGVATYFGLRADQLGIEIVSQQSFAIGTTATVPVRDVAAQQQSISLISPPYFCLSFVFGLVCEHRLCCN